MKTKILLTLLLIFSSQALADSTVATVDINLIINGFKDSQAKKKELDGLSQAARAKIAAKQKELTTLQEQIKSKNLSATSSEADTLVKKGTELQRYIKDTEEELKRKYSKYNYDLTKRAVDAVKKYAEANKIQIVLNKSNDAPGPVLFGSKAFDITDKVVASL